MDLLPLLHATFGFPGFRENQEPVCQALTGGRDVLLVMPTGAGKSLCYQLPAVARAGDGPFSPALVISPLIALMEDQAAKLTAHGLRVARIHSGLSRDHARQVCRDYLDGQLQFLFIAPERLRVPGFPEMLARRKPSLVAVDEAHCISGWGHDFRPDYRALGDTLPLLRPAPVIALTATATPAVQQDIVAQLRLNQPALFIHGFRRDNLAIEVVELSKPQRAPFIARYLDDPTARPAIVYAPSRKEADALAAELNQRFPAASYHAGLDAGLRDQVQRAFLTGKLEVIVATIAFGMGIDKPNIRTVLHASLPASLEGYYQEIGRAGRDGLPSRVILLHSFADRKIHESFFERDYPPVEDLARVARLLTEEFQPGELLFQKLSMLPEDFERAVNKLASQGAAQFDMEGRVRTPLRSAGAGLWRSGYQQQLAHRRAQLDRMVQFAETPQCRMSALVRHFGDTPGRPCGHCDFCSPEQATAQPYAEPTPEQERELRRILRELLASGPKSTGRLFTDVSRGPSLPAARRVFDALLDGLARAGLLTLTSETFTNPEGREITFRKAALTYEGRTLSDQDPLHVLLPQPAGAEAGSLRKPRKPKSDRSTGPATGAQTGEPAALTPEQSELESRLRAWRKGEAAAAGKPSFFVLHDAVLAAIVLAAPRTLDQLLHVHGIGPAKVDRYGAAIVALCRREGE
ncbi:MAG TPA: ATP-dependent DNA helicase RecQ [Acidobacteriaceae bacterium]|jgi:ATP-dependent DNA helicase RecQ|nr:ATP-dependent DNA helicase RecQ [Acidobacteriaceae bacterium]